MILTKTSMQYTFFHSTKYKLTLSLSVAVFFYVFLVFFLPFGVDNYNPQHQYTLDFLLEIFYFFLVVLSFSLINEFLIRPTFVKQATAKAIISWSLWSFVGLATFIFFTYNYLGNWHDFHFRSSLAFIGNCSSVLIFPTVGTFFFFRYHSLRDQMHHMLSHQEDPSSDELIQFCGQGTKDQITLASSIFLYGQAQDNYVELYYWKDQRVNKFLMRTSLSKLVASVNHPAIVRCHRSFLVNLPQVAAIKGGNSDLELHLRAKNLVVPVSKSYRQEVVSQLKVRMELAS